ncbi:MAG: site-2 protease family protein [Cenarchaeum sp. SB0661_bin_35]|nr:site-2 protease family protein [Cenarchaeum sp. SB0667_bin_13]MXZ92924.1 site-2 protease family protein [Cenarchaeum sp. SB0666_bin_15]MYC79181.1 site-2 protease family protein [Cenarchaeum sp. SB0661_bin_35]MYD59238.1 site-2 protease family protein [Cenarchaeum sp. SB0678_bin_8]MYI51294.1 site-2 protease family protein [Cenarchaeum sp. SB0673_bin_9]MYJ27198.1 site-2 protease family protein [Cenarchaeum sp. SB0672_bin_9]
MGEITREQVEEIVRSKFLVADSQMNMFSQEFRILDLNCTDKFADLARTLEGGRYVCRLLERDGDRYIQIQKFTPPKPGRILGSSMTPRILFVVVCAFVMIDGYYRTVQTNQITSLGDPIQMAVIYTIALLGILGVHEMGHLMAAKIHRLKTTWPFFIPGIPIIGIPTLGAFIQSSGLTINRKILFDVAVAGPLAGAVVAVIVVLIGAWTAPVIDEGAASMLESQGVLSEFQFGESILMHGSLELFGKSSSGVVILTPILWASWIGFLITFLNLLPAWQLDGGHMARTILGSSAHRYATYASIGVLVLLNYWVMAILILALSWRNPAATPLDDVSPLPQNRKVIYLGVVVLAVVCAPIPAGILP